MTSQENYDSSPGPRYRLEKSLGAGGMGEVFLAYDTQLQRQVALKRLKTDLPQLRERFLREAQHQARVKHENICRIYDTGEQDGYAYIVMQYIPGETLKSIAPQMSLREKTALMQTVAQALHNAHSAGLIHRDIKPANVMVETLGNGKKKPYLVDFGLAHEADSESRSLSRELIGTPHYMSPEQAQSNLDSLDYRSDIYSMGVMFYEVLCGKLPYSETQLTRFMLQMVQEEPPPLHRWLPDVPRDLETIVMKCLAKDPAARYSSAQVLADDLGRFLAGEPILARRYTCWQQLAKKIKKHKTLAILSTCFTILLLTVTGFWWHARWRSDYQAALARQLGRETQEIESIMKYAYLNKPHDIRLDRQAVRKKMTAIREKMDKLGNDAAGIGCLALGQGCMALRDYAQAKKHLEKAWKMGFQTPETAQSLGIVLGELYLQELIKINRAPKDLQTELIKKLEKEVLTRALWLLKQAGENQGVSPEYTNALIAFYQKKYSAALGIISRHFSSHQQLAEFKILEGDILQAQGMENWQKGDLRSARTMFIRSREAFQMARDTNRSDATVCLRISQLQEKMAAIELSSTGVNIQDLLEHAIKSADQALAIDPELTEAMNTRAAIYLDFAKLTMQDGLDPSSFLQKIQRDTSQVIRLAPENFYAYSLAGQALVRQSRLQNRPGQSQIEIMTSAIHYFNQALKIEPNDCSTILNLTWAYWELAYSQFVKGIRADDSINQALHYSLLMLRLLPGYTQAIAMLATVHYLKGIIQFNQGDVNWLEAMDLSTKYYLQAIGLNPRYIEYYKNMGLMLVDKSRFEKETGRDPLPTFREAIRVQQEGLKINPRFPYLYYSLGFIHCEWAQYHVSHGQDPTEMISQTQYYLNKAVKLNPGNILLPTYHIRFNNIQSQWALAQRKTLKKFLGSAQKYFSEGIALDPNSVELLNEWATAKLLQLREYIRQKIPCRAAISEIRGLLNRSLSIKPDYFLTHRLLGELALLEAHGCSPRGKNLPAIFAEARRGLEASLNLNPVQSETLTHMAHLCLDEGSWNWSQGKSPFAAVSAGTTFISQAIRNNPDNAEAYLVYSQLKQLESRTTSNPRLKNAKAIEAAQLLQKALRINPLVAALAKTS